MPVPNPSGFHPSGVKHQPDNGVKNQPGGGGGGGIIVPIGPGPFLPNVNDDVTAIVGYVLAHGCDGSDKLRTLVTLFQTSINALIAQNNQVHGLNEALLPVDGNLTGLTESSVGSYASGMGLKFTSCVALAPIPRTGGIGPGPQNPQTPAAPATSSNTMLYVGVGALAVLAVGLIMYASSGKKRGGKRSNPIYRKMSAGPTRPVRLRFNKRSGEWVVTTTDPRTREVHNHRFNNKSDAEHWKRINS